MKRKKHLIEKYKQVKITPHYKKLSNAFVKFVIHVISKVSTPSIKGTSN